MRSENNFLSRLPLALRLLVAIPWTIFWLVFAVLVAPIQIVIHIASLWGSAGKQLDNNFDRKRADEYFKRTIAFIELHKVRFGHYPDTFREDSFQELIGAWDKFKLEELTYSRLGDGYELNLNSQESLQLDYSTEFWVNLGLKKTNVGGFQS